MKKYVGKFLLLSSLAITSLLACKGNDKGGDSYTSKNVSVYIQDDYGYPENIGQIKLYFYDIKNLPYVDVEEYLDFFTGSYSVRKSNETFTFTNRIWNGKTYFDGSNNNNTYNATATYNSSTKQLVYGDIACFLNIIDSSANPMDLVRGKGIQLYEGLDLFELEENIYTAGSSTTINLGNYNIDTRVSNNKLMMPLYTAKCLFTSSTIPSFFYNGTALFQNITNDDSDYNRTIKSNLFTPDSAYLEYAFNQFKLDLDMNFGMNNYSRYQRNTKSKHEFKPSSKLAAKHDSFVKSATSFDSESVKFFASEMDDGGHTGVNSKSYYSSNPSITRYDLGNEIKYIAAAGDAIATKSRKVLDFEYNFGSQVSNSLSASNKTILRLDSFLTNEEGDRGIESILDLAYTNIQPTLIVDLSCNGGGYIFAQDMLTTYLTRGNSRHFAQNSINGSKCSVKYKIDLNGDGQFNTSKDLLPSTVTNIYIITSNQTFSAANATAALTAKYGTNVKMYGEHSGGGMCSVDNTMMNALGMCSGWSSTNRLKIDNDDTSYDKIDNPDYTLEKEFHSQGDGADPSKFYNYSNL